MGYINSEFVHRWWTDISIQYLWHVYNINNKSIVFITKAKAIAPRRPANHITTCMFSGITCFRPKLAKYDRGKMLHARPIRQNNITNRKNDMFIRAYRPVNSPIPWWIKFMGCHDNSNGIMRWYTVCDDNPGIMWYKTYSISHTTYLAHLHMHRRRTYIEENKVFAQNC